MGLHDVVRVLKAIDKHGHMAKFVRAAKEQKAAGTFDAKAVNFVKDFMVKNKMHNDPIGKHIVNAAQAGPRTAMARGRSGRFNCDFGGESAGGRHGSGGGRPRLPFPGGPHGTGGGPDE